MELKVVTDSDKEFVMSIDKYIDDTGYSNRVYTKSGYVIWGKPTCRHNGALYFVG